MYETRCASFERAGILPLAVVQLSLPKSIWTAALVSRSAVSRSLRNTSCLPRRQQCCLRYKFYFDVLFARRLSSDTAGSGCRGQESYLSTRVCSRPRVGTQLVPRRVLLIQLCALHLSRLLVCRSGNEAANSAYSTSLRLIRILFWKQ